MFSRFPLVICAIKNHEGAKEEEEALGVFMNAIGEYYGKNKITDREKML